MKEIILTNVHSLKLPQPKAATSASSAPSGFDGITIYFDGSCTPNPGAMRYGIIATDGGRVILEIKGDVGADGHNGIAEALGLRRAFEVVAAIKATPALSAKPLRIVGDGQNAINAINNVWTFRAEPERTIIEEAKTLREALEPGYASKLASGTPLDLPVEKIPDAENLAHDAAQ